MSVSSSTLGPPPPPPARGSCAKPVTCTVAPAGADLLMIDCRLSPAPTPGPVSGLARFSTAQVVRPSGDTSVGLRVLA